MCLGNTYRRLQCPPHNCGVDSTNTRLCVHVHVHNIHSTYRLRGFHAGDPVCAIDDQINGMGAVQNCPPTPPCVSHNAGNRSHLYRFLNTAGRKPPVRPGHRPRGGHGVTHRVAILASCRRRRVVGGRRTPSATAWATSPATAEGRDPWQLSGRSASRASMCCTKKNLSRGCNCTHRHKQLRRGAYLMI